MGWILLHYLHFCPTFLLVTSACMSTHPSGVSQFTGLSAWFLNIWAKVVGKELLWCGKAVAFLLSVIFGLLWKIYTSCIDSIFTDVTQRCTVLADAFLPVTDKNIHITSECIKYSDGYRSQSICAKTDNSRNTTSHIQIFRWKLLRLAG